jgi:hypothetical protein
MKTQVTLLNLKYSISFNDADSGACYAGDGLRVLRVYQSESDAREVMEKFNPILAAAEKEKIVLPVQMYNKELKNEFGFVIHDVDSGYDFKLELTTMTVNTKQVD